MKPARLTPPHKIVQRELAARRWTIEDLAIQGCIDRCVLLGVINGIVPVSSCVVVPGLSKAFGTSVEFWVDLQKNGGEARR